MRSDSWIRASAHARPGTAFLAPSVTAEQRAREGNLKLRSSFADLCLAVAHVAIIFEMFSPAVFAGTMDNVI